jgi:hypothetical protein
LAAMAAIMGRRGPETHPISDGTSAVDRPANRLKFATKPPFSW